MINQIIISHPSNKTKSQNSWISSPSTKTLKNKHQNTLKPLSIIQSLHGSSTSYALILQLIHLLIGSVTTKINEHEHISLMKPVRDVSWRSTINVVGVWNFHPVLLLLEHHLPVTTVAATKCLVTPERTLQLNTIDSTFWSSYSE